MVQVLETAAENLTWDGRKLCSRMGSRDAKNENEVEKRSMSVEEIQRRRRSC